MTTTLDWYGCATFRLRAAGLTIFLDAYVDRVPEAPGPGVGAADIDECDWIVVGHSHFDHLFGAETIAANRGCRIIASYESVRVLEACGVPLDRMLCVAGGERVDLGNGVRVSVFPSQHSCVWTHAQMPQPAEVCLGDLGLTWQEQLVRFAGLAEHFARLGPSVHEHLQATAQGARGDGGALLYVFDTPDGRVLYQDTSGHWSGVLGDLRPDVAILAAAGRGNVDGEPVQGTLVDFLVRQVALLQPRRVVLSHHDDWLPGFSIDTDLAPIRAGLTDVELLELGYVDGTVILQ